MYINSQACALTYKHYPIMLSQPDQKSLKVFSTINDDVEMEIALTHEDDLLKALSVAKEMIDEWES